MQLKVIFTVLAALVPLGLATSVSTNCKANEFKQVNFAVWSDKNCCLPRGGPPTPPAPPKGANCPPTSYYWEPKQGCCVPRQPPPSNPPPPQCPKGWYWRPNLWRCEPEPTQPTPPPTQPSPKPYSGGNSGNHGSPGNGHHKRVAKSRASLCPTGLEACPLSGLASNDFECVDTASELESCGGCTSLDQGQDCTAIHGAWNVACEQGSCAVLSCAGGFKIGKDKKTCIPN